MNLQHFLSKGRSLNHFFNSTHDISTFNLNFFPLPYTQLTFVREHHKATGMNIGFNKKTIVIREYRLDIGSVQVFDDYMVATFDEGSTVTLERVYQIIGISEIHFRNKPFGYISMRKNSYAVDPVVYTYIRGLKNLKAFAIVSKKEIDMHNFKIEKLFYKKNMEFFIEYDNALAWVRKKLDTKKKKKKQ